MASSDIDRPYGRGLGDCVSTINYLIHHAKQTGEPVKLNQWYLKETWKRYADTIPQLLPLFEDAALIQLVDLELEEQDRLKPKLEAVCGGIAWNAPLLPVYRWKGVQSRLVAFQFDGRAKAGEKNLEPQEQQQVLAAIRSRGYQPVKLGLPLSLEQSAYLLARSRALVAVHSGFAMLAKNTGLPVYIPQMRMPAERLDSHKNYKGATITKGVDELIAEIDKL